MLGPLILIDVDGTVASEKRDYMRQVKRDVYVEGDRLKLFIDPKLGRSFLDLAAETKGELIWCTFWNEHANFYIAPIIRLMPLPVIEIPTYMDGNALKWTMGRWKSEMVVEHVKLDVPTPRPIMWFDDMIDEQVMTHMADELGDYPFYPGHSKPRTGLLPEDFELARNWYKELTSE